jgi:hypothetical protein
LIVINELTTVAASVMEANASRYHGKAPDELGLDGRTASEAGGDRKNVGERKNTRAEKFVLDNESPI